jgi:DNA-binding transcriptional LysR family regulator
MLERPATFLARPVKPRISVGTEELETFLMIADLGSFSKAAELLSLAQPSISNRIQRLERAFQTRLFERTSHGVVLTSAGQRLRTRIEPIIRGLHSILEEFNVQADVRYKSIVVATSPMLAAHLLPIVLKAFSEAHPTVHIELQDRIPSTLVSDIHSGRIDIALLAQPMPLEGLAFELLTADRLMVVGSRGHRALGEKTVHIEDFIRNPLLLPAGYTIETEKLLAEAAARNVRLPITRTMSNVSTLLGLVSAGLGLTLLPNVITRVAGIDRDEHFSVCLLEGLLLTREYGIVSRPNHRGSPVVKALAAALRQALLSHAWEKTEAKELKN